MDDFSAEDLEFFGRVIERDCDTVPPRVIRYMVAAAVEKMGREDK